MTQRPPLQPVGKTISPPWTPKSYPNPQEAAEYMTKSSITQNLVVESLGKQHSASLYRSFAAAGPDFYKSLFTYSGTHEPSSEQDFASWIEAISNKKDPMFFVIIDKKSAAAVGIFSFLRTDVNNGVTEIGWIKFSPHLQRTSLATEALYVSLRYVFDVLGYRRYEWKCDALNAASMAAAKRFGFQYEGTFRQAVVVKGRNRDTAWWSITNDEYRGFVRIAFEAWLSHKNFQADGQQLMSLSTLTYNGRQAHQRALPDSKL